MVMYNNYNNKINSQRIWNGVDTWSYFVLLNSLRCENVGVGWVDRVYSVSASNLSRSGF